MIYVYRQRSSISARALANALGARRVRRLNAIVHPELIVAWGESVPARWRPLTLNGGVIISKDAVARRLQAEGVPTVEISRRPGTPITDWLPRQRDHVGGADLLEWDRWRDEWEPACIVADFWSKREELCVEYRVHSFLGRSIRAGRKVPRLGLDRPPHPWIRSWDSGWRIMYGELIQQRYRDLAHQAVAALGLDFGAVDLGERRDGSLLVLEVNLAPGIEGGTIEAYRRAVQRVVDEGR